MTLAPLLVATPAIQFHVFAAMSAFALGPVQFVAPKGTLARRTLGWIWVALMLVVSAMPAAMPSLTPATIRDASRTGSATDRSSTRRATRN